MQRLLLLFAFAFLTTLANARDNSISIEQTSGNPHLSQSSSSDYSLQSERPWLLRVSSGGSWMPWYIEEENPLDYQDKLACGFHVDGSGHYLFNQYLGLGLQYSFFTANTDGSNPALANYYSPVYALLHEKRKLYTHYVGLSLVSQQFIGESKKVQLSETLSGGMVFYRDESQVLLEYPHYQGYYIIQNDNSLTTGHTFAARFGLSLEYFLSPSLSIGVGGNFLFGLLKKVNKEEFSPYYNSNVTNKIDLRHGLKISRIDYSLGLNFYF